MRPETQHADPKRVSTAEHRARDVHVLPGIHAREELTVHVVQVVIRVARRSPTEGRERELGLGEDLHVRHPSELVGRPLSEIELFIQARAKGLDSKELDRKPRS